MRQLINTEEAVTSDVQHTQACSDCPWSRKALPGWLGGPTAEDWIAEAHSDNRIPCHVISNQQCAGAAVYRANICKRSRDPEVLRLPRDTDTVFATRTEFLEHHNGENHVHD